jgi:hypothetical protein
MQEFPEVFANETREVKEKESTGKWERVKPEEGMFGDYADPDEEDIDMEDIADNLVIDSDDASTDAEINRFRARFMVLVSLRSSRCRYSHQKLFRVATISGSGFNHPADVLDTITEVMRPMGFETFTQLVNHIKLPADEYAAFLVNNMFPLLVSPPASYNVMKLAQSDLEHTFISAVASSNNAIDAAKLSFLIEKLLANLGTRDQLVYRTDLVNAVNNGIMAREHKAIHGDRVREDEQAAEEELTRSGRRIVAFMKMLKG